MKPQLLDANGEIPLYILVQHVLSTVAHGSTIVLITPAIDTQIINTAIEIQRRGILPIVILIDKSTFEVTSQIRELESNLIALGIQVIRISLGDDLKSCLETGIWNLRKENTPSQRTVLV